MSIQPLIEAAELQALIREEGSTLFIADCRYVLTDPEAGKQAYTQGHIPGAVHVDLGSVLSTPTTGMNGRHPLPDPEAFAHALAELGVDDDTLVVAYDAEDASFAARLWWMLRWIGHERVRVLNGGLRAWLEAGGTLSTTPAATRKGTLSARRRSMPTVTFGDVLTNLTEGRKVVVDARSPDRYRGENETIDPIGGRIPGARNRFFKDNLDAQGRFKPADTLRAEFQAVLGDTAPENVINQCGSGVTACHNLLAMEVAGLHGAALYPGSWSEWCRQRDVPVERG